MNNLTPSYLNDLLTIKTHSDNFRYQRTVEVPQVRTVEHDPWSFRSTAAKIWNSLPQNLRDSFQKKINKNKCIERGILFMFILFCWLYLLPVCLFSCKLYT